MVLKLGLALDFQSATRPLSEHLAAYVSLIHRAEAVGFDSVSAGETYPTRMSAGHLPSPLLALASIARETHLRLGTGVVLLPAWNPLRLAYDAAVLDQISGGRAFLGVGLGGTAVHRRFGFDPSRLADYMDDALAALRALWSGERGFTGKTFAIDGGIGLLPIQQGGPPLFVGGSIRRSVERAATWGDGYIASSNYSVNKVAQQSQRYRAALSERGKNPAIGQVMVNRLTLVAETDAKAREDARRYVGAVLQAYARTGSLGQDERIMSASPADLFEEFDAD
ncbi:MAG: hypothetical protein HW416_3289, partial [Chloroflexi bacterium]|nr:hypothetical protein [Chloroflexota bacterium]